MDLWGVNVRNLDTPDVVAALVACATTVVIASAVYPRWTRLRWGLRCGSMCGGGTQCGTPSSMIAYQPCRIRSLLSWPQARASVSMLVWPPLTQSVMWCNAAKLGGCVRCFDGYSWCCRHAVIEPRFMRWISLELCRG